MATAIRPGPMNDLWNEIVGWLLPLEECGAFIAKLERNFVLAGFPDLWLRYDWKDALRKLTEDIALFHLPQVQE
jgi:hypothetical protein